MNSGATLNLNSLITGTAGILKSDGGTLILNPPASTIPGISANTFTNIVGVAGGTLILGSNNAITPNQYLRVGPGATFDLNGKTQYVLGFLTDTGLQNVGGSLGTVKSGTGTGNLIINNDNAARIWSGVITDGGGKVNIIRSGLNSTTFFSDNDYTGTTVINSGTLILKDGGKLSGTSNIDLNYATFTIDNTGTIDVTDRINNSATIMLRGGVLNFSGRALTASTETLGAVTLAEGLSTITPAIGGGTGVQSADLTLTSLIHNTGGGMVNFASTTLGLLGNSARILIPTITVNGVSSSTATAGGGLTNNIIGGWAIVNGTTASDFASYSPTLGVGGLGAVGFAGYSNVATAVTASTIDTAGANAVLDLNTASITSLITGNRSIAAVRFNNVAQGGVNFQNAGNTLTIGTGGFLVFSTPALTFGSAPNNGKLTSGAPELDVYNQGGGGVTFNSIITGSIALVKAGAGAGVVTLAGTNDYTGGTFVDQGTLVVASTGLIPLATTPANGLVISGSTVTFNAASTATTGIASGNVITLNGTATLNLFGNNTVAGIVMNNDGGTVSTLNTFSTGSNNGTLTLGASGITGTSSNVTTLSLVAGRLDLGTAKNTVNIAPISTTDGVDINPLQATLALQGMAGNTGGFDKTGNGVLQFNAQDTFTGQVHVKAGGVQIGVAGGGSRYSQLNLDSGTRLNLNALATTLGSLTGSGNVVNSGAAAVLTVGFDNTNTTFSGQLQRFNDANIPGVALTKIGTGTLTITSAQSATTGSSGAIVVSGGGLTYSGAGAPFQSLAAAVAPNSAVTFTVNVGGTLTLVNAAGAPNNRLGLSTAGVFNLFGGSLSIGNTGVTTSEGLIAFNVNNGGGLVTLAADATSQLNLAITTLSAETAPGTALIRGIAGTAAANGNPTLAITTPTLIAGQGTGLTGSSTMPVRRDIIADAGTGFGTGFLVKDTNTNLYRALGNFASGELNLVPTTWATTQNAGINGTSTSIAVNTTANTMTFGGTTASLNSGLPAAFGLYNASGALLTQSMVINGALVLDGSTSSSNVGSFTGTAATTWAIHTAGSSVFNMNSYFGILNTAGIAKADDGTLNFNSSTFFTGGMIVNGGTLNLASGLDNTLAVIPGITAPTVNALSVNGPSAVVDLKTNNQVVGAISSINTLPGMGGTIQGSGTLTAGVSNVTLTSTVAGNFGGAINGTINFSRDGTGTTLLASASGYSGITNVRGATLQLRDSGSILGTSAINLLYGTLNVDQSGLNPAGNLNPTRVAATTPITMQGATLTLTPGGSMDAALTVNNLTLSGGANIITPTLLASTGSTTAITIGNLKTTDLLANGGTLNISTAAGLLGFGQAQVFINGVNGGAAPANSSTFGPNFVVNGDYAGYLTTQGIAALGTAGFPTYGAALASGANTPAVINANGASFAIAAGTTTGSMKIGGSAAVALTFTNGTATGGTDTLNLTLGGLLQNNTAFAVNIGTAAARGIITTGGTATSGTVDLVAYQSQNSTTIESVIQNNGLGAITRLVKSGAGTLVLTAPNTYGGGTIVNQGTLTLNTLTANVVIPGDLTINNAAVNFGGAVITGQIATSSNLTINGGGSFTLPNYSTGPTQTLASVTFNNSGGTASPAFAFGTPTALTSTIVLSAANAITATNDSMAFAPSFTTGAAALTALQLSNAAPVIRTSGLSPNDLSIAVVINSAGGPISKMGSGSVDLGGASTFTTGFNLNEGSLLFGVNSTGTTPSVSNGPVGLGTLTIAGGTSLLSDGTARVVGNAIVVTGDFTFGGVTAGNNTTLSGTIALGSATRQITVASPAVTDTISGAITATGTAGLTKAGPGNLTLSSAGNSWGGTTTVSGGILQLGAIQTLPNSPLNVAAGAVFNQVTFSSTFGSLSGAGVITNSSTTSTLSIGGDNAATSTFNGIITAATVANLSLTKIGTGNQILTQAETYAGATNVNAGTLTFNGAGSLVGATGQITVSDAGTLVLDNVATNTANRLGGRPVAVAGGTLNVTSNGTGALSETAGALTVPGGGGAINFTAGGANTSNILTFSTFTAPTLGGTLAVNGAGLGLSSGDPAKVNVKFVTAPTLTAGLVSAAAYGNDGTNVGFLTYDNTNGLRVLTGSDFGAFPVQPTLTPFTAPTASTNNVLLTSNQTYTADTTVNSITINTGGGITSTGATVNPQLWDAAGSLNTLTVTSGGVLVNAANAIITNGNLTAGAAALLFNTQGNLTSTSYLTGSSAGVGIDKVGAGTLTLSTQSYLSGSTVINEGSIVLNSGVANTLLVIPTATVATVGALTVNAGGSLDLNGNNQAVGAINSIDVLTGTGGSITNSSSTTTVNLVSNPGVAPTTFAGVISGRINFTKAGLTLGVLTLNTAQTYTGTTTVQGGGLTLIDNATLPSASTAAIAVNGSTLKIDNSGLYNINDRLPDNAPINLKGGTLSMTGANIASTSETVGAAGAGVSALQGLNTITVTPPAAGTLNRAVLNIGTLTRSTGATLVFTGANLGSSVPGAAQIIPTNIDPGTGTAAAPTNPNGILGGWATAGAAVGTPDSWAINAGAQTLTATTNGTTTVTLTSGNTSQMVVGQPVTGNANIPAGATIATITGAQTFTLSAPATTGTSVSTNFGNAGIAALNATSGYTNITAYATQGALTSTANYSINTVTTLGTVTLATGGNTINSLQISPGVGGIPTLDLGGGQLVVTSGGIMRTSLNTSATTIQNGTLTAGSGTAPAELFFQLNNITSITTVSASITDNSGKAVTLVKAGASGVNSLLTLTGNNSYSGGTVVNSGTLTLNTASANGTTTVAVPGNLTINDTGITTLSAAGQIKNTAAVMLNGGATLNLTGANTVASLAFNDNGGVATPTVALGTSGALTLSGNNALTVVNDNLATTPTISGTTSTITLTGSAPVVDVSGLSPQGLILGVPITVSTGGLLKKGAGNLILNAANSYQSTDPNAGLVLQDGGLIIAATTVTLGNTANKLVIGNATAPTVPLTLTAIASGTSIVNPTVIGQNFTFGGTAALAPGLNLSGTMDLGAATRTITVTTPQSNAAISGAISSATGTTGIIKDGVGTLLIGSAAPDTYTGATTVNLGLLKLGAAAVNAIADTSSLKISLGAAFDLAGRGETVGSLADGTGGGGLITNSGAAAAAFAVGGDNSNTSFSGFITNSTNAINLAKIGTGTQTLTGANAYSGTTTVTNGALTLSGSAGTLYTGLSGLAHAITISNGGVVNVNDTTNVANRLGGSNGTLALGGTLNIIGNSTGALTEQLGATTLGAGESNINFTINGGASNNLTMLNFLGTTAGSTLFIGGTNLGIGAPSSTNTNVTVLSAPPVPTGSGPGILANAFGDDGTNKGFLTYDTNGFRVVKTSELSAFPVQPTAPVQTGIILGLTITPTTTNNILLSTANGGTLSMTQNTTVNSLTFNSGGGILSVGANQVDTTGAALATNGNLYNSAAALNTLTVTSGGVISYTGNTGIKGGVLTAGAVALTVLTPGDLSLGYLTGTGGLIKAGTGNLTLNKTDYITGGTGTTINDGTVTLNGGANTIVATPTNTGVTVGALVMNGGTLNLNGNDQIVGVLSSTNAVAGGFGGTITNTGTTSNFTTVGAITQFDGLINGNLNYYKAAGVSAEILVQANTYNGTTNVQGVGLTLKDAGTILNSGTVNINGATLLLDNTGIQDIARLKSNVVVNLNGGALSYTGQLGQGSTAAIGSGNTNLLQGLSTITATASSGAATMTIANLVRSAGASANFTGTSLGATGVAGNILLTQLNTSAFSVTNLTNGLIGGWATVAGADFASYTNANGVVALPAGSYTTVSALDQGIGGGALNATISAAAPATNTNTTLAFNSLRFTATSTATLLAGTTLTLTTGGLLSNAATATAITGGTALTSSTSELDVYNNGAGVFSIATPITGAGVSLVKSGSGPATLTSANGFGGTTYVNQGTLNLGAASAVNVIPNNLVINGNSVTASTTVMETTAFQQIPTTSTVTLNGSALLTLNSTVVHTLAGLVFVNNGGTVTPTVATGASKLTLSNSNTGGTFGNPAIDANSYNAGTVDTISGLLDFSGTAPEVFVKSNDATGAFYNKVAPDLNISAVIQVTTAHQLSKTGNGVLALTAANLNAGAAADAGWKVVDGTLILVTATSLGAAANSPLVIGDTTTAPSAAGITIIGGAAVTIAAGSAITLNRDVTFGGTTATNNLTFSGTTALGAANRTITVTNPQVAIALNGIISSTGAFGFTKAGDGTLSIGGANNYTGATAINAGILKLGATNALPSTTDLTIAATGVLDLANKATTIQSLAGSGLITNSANAITLTVGNATFSGSTTFSGTITQGVASQATGLTKAGDSVLILSGVNTYDGTTTIADAGTGLGGVIVNGSLANTNVLVNGGGFLGGKGTIGVSNNAQLVNTGGSVTVAAGTTAATRGAIDLTRDAAIGTLTIQGNSGTNALVMGSATANNFSVLVLDTNGTGTDQIVIGNNAKANLTSNTGKTLEVDLNGLGGSTLPNGVYNLINYGAGNGAGVLATLGANSTQIVKGTDTSSAGGASTTSFNITSTALQLFVGASNTYFWNGTTNGSWNFGNPSGPTNWLNGLAGTDPNTVPGAADTVNFNSTGAAGNFATTLDANFSINALTFGSGSNSTNSVSVDVGASTLSLNAGGITQASGSAANSISASGAGGINLVATQAWTNNSSTNLTVSAPISGVGGLFINGSGTGKVVLGGATSNSFTGGTTIAGTAVGTTLQLATSNNALGATTGPLAVNTGTLDMNGNNATVGSLTGVTATASNAVITNSNAGTTSTLTVNQSVNSTYQGVINDTGTGKVALVKSGVGILVLAPGSAVNSTYSGGTTISANGGTIQVGAGSAATEPTSGAANSVGVLGTGPVTVNLNGTLAFNGVAATQFNVPNSVTLNGGTLIDTLGLQHIGNAAGAATGTFAIGASGGTLQAAGAATNDLFIDSQLTGSGALSVIGGGASLVHFTNSTNSYSGILSISSQANSLISVDAANALAAASVVNVGGTANGLAFGVTSATLGSLAGTSAFALSQGANGVALTVGGNGNSTAYSGIISGTNAGTSLIKTGGGVLTLSGVNTFTGGAGNGLVVSQGTVLLTTSAVAGGAATQAITLNNANTSSNNTSLLVSGAAAANLTIANPIVVTANGSGTTSLGTFGGGATFGAVFSGGVTLGKDLTLTATAGNTLSFTTVAIDSNTAGLKTLTYAGPGNGVISSSITNTSGSTGLTLNDTYPGATLTLNTGTNNYSGATTITAGTLVGGIATAFSANSAYTLANSVLASLTTGGFATTVGSLSGGGTSGGNITLTAAGSLTVGNLGASATYAGAFSSTGVLATTGSGYLNLTGISTNTGATTVSGTGGLLFNGIMAATAATVNTGATLGGSGITAGTVTVAAGGNLSPGGTVTAGAYTSTIGTLATGVVTLTGADATGSTAVNSKFIAQLGTAGATHVAPGLSDRVNTTGNVTVAGTLALVDNAGANSQGSFGQSGVYKIMGYTGTATVANANVFPTISYNGTNLTLSTLTTNTTALATGTTTVGSSTNGITSTIHGLVVNSVTADKAVYLDVYGYAQPSAATPVSFGFLHTGSTATTQGLTVSNGAAANAFSEGVGATLGAGGGSGLAFTSSGSIAGTGVAGGASNSTGLTLTLTSTASPGIITSGTQAVNYSSIAVTGSGLTNTTLAGGSVNVTGAVYSGQGVWAGAGSGSWGSTGGAVANGNWTTNGSALAADYTNAALPGIDGALSINDTATFGASLAAGTVSLNGAVVALNQITFNGGTTGTLATGSGGTLTLRASSAPANPAITATSANGHLTAPVILANDLTVTATGAADSLSLTGGITGSGKNVSVGGAGSTAISAIQTGTGTLTKANAGTLTLSGASTYTGATAVNGGSLILSGGGGATVLGGTSVSVASTATFGAAGAGVTNFGTVSAGTINLSAGATLSLQDSTINSLNFLNATAGTNLTIGAGSALNFDVNATANTTDQIVVGQKVNLASGGAIVSLNTFSGTQLALGSYDLITFASGSTLTGNFTFTGGNSTLQAGGGLTYTLQLDAAAGSATRLQLVVATNATPNPVYWSGARNTSWSSLGLSNQSNWVNGPTGTDTLQLPGSTSAVFFTANTASNLTTTLDGSYSIASLNFTGAGTAADASPGGNVTINNGTGTNLVTIGVGGISDLSTSGAHTIAANVSLGANQTWSNSSSGVLTVTGGVGFTGGTGKSLQVAGSGNTAIGGVIAIGDGSLTKTGTGTLTLTGANTYTGGTTVNQGTLTVGTGGTLGANTGTLAVNNTSAGSGTAVVLNLATTVDTLVGSLSGTITNPGGGNTTNIVTGNTGTTFGVSQTTPGTFDGVISGNGGFRLRGSSTSTLTLTGANTYAGPTTVNNGTLTIGTGGRLGSTTAALVVSNTSATVAATVLNLSTSADTVSGSLSGSITTAGSTATINNGGSGRNFTVNQTADASYAGTIAGAGSFTLGSLSTNTLTLNNANTYGGTTTINGGTLKTGVSAAIPTGTAVVFANASGATLDLNSLNQTVASISGGGSTGGNINLGSGTLTAGDSSPTSYAGAMQGIGGFTKAGSGTTTLSGANNYSGATTVNAGKLVFASNTASANAFSIVNSGANAEVAVSTISGSTIESTPLNTVASATTKVLKTTSLTMAGGTILNLTNNGLLIDYTGATVYGDVFKEVQNGFNGGHWDGGGTIPNSGFGAISASSASTDTVGAIGYLTAIGVIDNSYTDAMGTHTVSTSFMGRSVDGTSVLVRYTLYGDANLDGKIDSYDYSQIDAAYAATHYLMDGGGHHVGDLIAGSPTENWYNGDFNYDGVVDGADYALIDTANAFSGGTGPSMAALYQEHAEEFGASYTQQVAALTAGTGPVSVPEPGSFAMVSVGALLLGLRRRRTPAK